MRRLDDLAPVQLTAYAPAGAGAHGREEDEERGPRSPLAGPGKPDGALLQRLAEGTEDLRPEVREVLEDQDAPVGEIELARPPLGPEETSRGAGRMRHPDRREYSLEARLPGASVHGRDLPGLLLAQGRQEAGKRADEPGLPGARGTDEQEVMSAGKRDLKGAPRTVIPGDGDIAEVLPDHGRSVGGTPEERK